MMSYADIVLLLWRDAREDEGANPDPLEIIQRFRLYLACLEEILCFEPGGPDGDGGEPMPEPQEDPADVVTPLRRVS